MPAQEPSSSLPRKKPSASSSPDTKGVPNSKGSEQIQLTARLEPEVHRYLKLIAETEDLSLNEAINLIISRYHHYPKDMAEIHRQILYCKGQLEIIQNQMELSELHENRLIQLIEGNAIEERLRALQEQEEAALEFRHPLPKVPSEGTKPDPGREDD